MQGESEEPDGGAGADTPFEKFEKFREADLESDVAVEDAVPEAEAAAPATRRAPPPPLPPSPTYSPSSPMSPASELPGLPGPNDMDADIAAWSLALVELEEAHLVDLVSYKAH